MRLHCVYESFPLLTSTQKVCSGSFPQLSNSQLSCVAEFPPLVRVLRFFFLSVFRTLNEAVPPP